MMENQVQSVPNTNIVIRIASAIDNPHAEKICEMIEESARIRGTGIAKRNPEYIRKKLTTGHSAIAFDGDKVVGFCYIETWSHERFVANSGLIVHPDYRKHGLAKKIKKVAFDLARDLHPEARVFGITTSLAVMKINTELGYVPVTFSELSQDEAFWNGCQSCPNFDILQRNNRRMCLCTGMLAPSKIESMGSDLSDMVLKNKIYENP